ncbi:MAG: gamma-glutamyl-phosphate reductase, partial [Clostridia bacterium]|nr:gamma-glutamyl-phosphate reductase [Clostridia bacterium]
LGVCNALEGLVIDRAALDKALPVLDALKKAGVTLHGDGEIRKIFPAAVAATEDDYYKEYLSLDISVKTVDGVKGAVEYVNKYGSHHSETIIATDRAAVEYFGKYADSAVVYANASTRFTDGFEFGLGAEIGISTQKLHARGPMGIYEMVTYKYLVEGDGQIRR